MNRILSMLSLGCSRHCDKEDGDPMFTMGQFTVPKPVLEILGLYGDLDGGFLIGMVDGEKRQPLEIEWVWYLAWVDSCRTKMGM